MAKVPTMDAGGRDRVHGIVVEEEVGKPADSEGAERTAEEEVAERYAMEAIAESGRDAVILEPSVGAYAS